MTHRKRSVCRACNGYELRPFLCLGPTPLANSFLQPSADFSSEVCYPLDVYFCNGCGLVQLLDVINPAVLFKHYIYVTGTSETIEAHNRQYARTLTELLALDQSRLVIEIASNDGSLLRCFQEQGARVLGIEPAENIAEMARSRGVETINRFFNHAVARELKASTGSAQAIIANNVLAHVDETLDFLKGCRHLLDRDGLCVIEVPYLLDLVERLEFDTIYHEHLCYFSVASLVRLYDQAGLSITRIEHVPVHGGSLRLYAGRQDRLRDHGPAVYTWVERERSAGLADFSRFQQFAAEVENNRDLMLSLLYELKGRGSKLAAYGAPAKGNTLLNYFKLDTGMLPFTVDRNPMKVGLVTPGCHIPILPVSALLERQPDHVIILAWNFADEVIRQQHEYRKRGGRFIIPVPKPKVL